MHPSARALLTVALCASPLCAATARPPARMAELRVVTAGNEPALRYRHATIARPFGAQLVDRMAIVQRFTLGRERLYLVRGEAGSDCPARYLVVVIRPGAAPSLTAPFGSCQPGATARLARGQLLISLPPAHPGEMPERYAYAQGAVTPAGPFAVRPRDTGVARRQDEGGSCRPYREIGAAHGNVAQALDQLLPEGQGRPDAIKHRNFAPSEMRALVAGLACLAALPDRDRLVTRRATPLFANRRHGDAAYAALDDLARSPGTQPDLRAALRAFSAQMHYAVASNSPG